MREEGRIFAHAREDGGSPTPIDVRETARSLSTSRAFGRSNRFGRTGNTRRSKGLRQRSPLSFWIDRMRGWQTTASTAAALRATVAARIEETTMQVPPLDTIPDLRTRASANLACMQFEAAHRILMANQELYGHVAMDPTIVIAFAQLIATNHASTHLVGPVTP
jgi:hypothetical protein